VPDAGEEVAASPTGADPPYEGKTKRCSPGRNRARRITSRAERHQAKARAPAVRVTHNDRHRRATAKQKNAAIPQMGPQSTYERQQQEDPKEQPCQSEAEVSGLDGPLHGRTEVVCATATATRRSRTETKTKPGAALPESAPARPRAPRPSQS